MADFIGWSAGTSTFSTDPHVFIPTISVFFIIFLGLITAFVSFAALWMLYRFFLLIVSPFATLIRKILYNY